MFNFSGDLLASKSWMNRALILQTWNPGVKILGSSSADDVVYLQKALSDWRNGETTFNAGHGGTTFRFLAVRLSRETGQFFIKASPALLKRPQKDLISFLESVGVKGSLKSDGLEIQSQGWRDFKRPIPVNTETSSQFISAVILSSINLPDRLDLQLSERVISENYLQMTLALLKKVGVDIHRDNQKITVSAGAKLQATSITAELDVSSAFSLICAAVLDGEVTITNWSTESSQPDLVFLKIFDQMNIQYHLIGRQFKIEKQNGFIGTDFNIGNSPDLFPILCVLAVFAQTPSRFFGAPHLKYKESDRLQKTAELLRLCGIKHELFDDGMIVHPLIGQNLTPPTKPLHFDPANDHRMAMAAALLKLKNFPIHIEQPEVVQKSYPEFYKHINLKIGVI